MSRIIDTTATVIGYTSGGGGGAGGTGGGGGYGAAGGMGGDGERSSGIIDALLRAVGSFLAALAAIAEVLWSSEAGSTIWSIFCRAFRWSYRAGNRWPRIALAWILLIPFMITVVALAEGLLLKRFDLPHYMIATASLSLVAVLGFITVITLRPVILAVVAIPETGRKVLRVISSTIAGEILYFLYLIIVPIANQPQLIIPLLLALAGIFFLQFGAQGSATTWFKRTLIVLVALITLAFFWAEPARGESQKPTPSATVQNQAYRPAPPEREVLVSQINSEKLIPNTWTRISNPTPRGGGGEISWNTPDGFLWVKKPSEPPSKASRLRMGVRVEGSCLGENGDTFDVLSEEGGVVFMKIKKRQ